MPIPLRAPGGGMKYGDSAWKNDLYRPARTIYEAVWANESMESFSGALKCHAASGNQYVGSVIWFGGVRGDAAALARLDGILQEDPRAKLEDYVSILFVFGPGEAGQASVWGLGEAAQAATLSLPNIIEEEGSTPFVPPHFFASYRADFMDSPKKKMSRDERIKSLGLKHFPVFLTPWKPSVVRHLMKPRKPPPEPDLGTVRQEDDPRPHRRSLGRT